MNSFFGQKEEPKGPDPMFAGEFSLIHDGFAFHMILRWRLMEMRMYCALNVSENTRLISL